MILYSSLNLKSFIASNIRLDINQSWLFKRGSKTASGAAYSIKSSRMTEALIKQGPKELFS